MSKLKPKQRALLKSIAQAVKPIVQVGKDGITETVSASVTAALSNRELLKVKVLDTAPASAQELGEQLVESVADAHLVQVIGRTIVIYRRHPEKPIIQLPT